MDPTEHSVSIHHLEGAQYLMSLSTPMVLEVKAIVDGVRTVTPPDAPLVDALHQTLVNLYGSRLTASTDLLGYRLVWNGEEWVFVCDKQMTFEIDFGTRGTVVVEASDAEIG